MMGKIGYSEEIKKEVLARVTGSEKENILKVSKDKITIIPCSVDFDLFLPANKEEKYLAKVSFQHFIYV